MKKAADSRRRLDDDGAFTLDRGRAVFVIKVVDAAAFDG